MMQSLIQVKPFCENYQDVYPELELSDDEWDDIIQLTDGLEPAKIATKLFQHEQLTFGDFYGAWLKCKFDTRKIGTTFARSLVSALEKREKSLLNNDAFVAAILLDPR